MFPLSPWAAPRSSFVQPVEPPTVDPDVGGLISISFNPAWLPVVLGALSQLTQLTTWIGDDDAKRLAVERATGLMNLVGYPVAAIPGVDPMPAPVTRYDPTCDCVQTSLDGGTTWIDNPAGDPRTASSLPPQTGSNADCNSAASARKYLVRFVGVLQTVGGTGVTATGLGYAILGVLIDLTGPWAIIADVVIGAALGMIAAGLTAINDAFSDTNLDTLECIIFCHTQLGKLSPAAFGQVLSDVGSQIGGTDATILTAVLTLMGVGGLNSAMALKLDTDDCSGCGCGWCHTFDFTVSADGWNFYDGTRDGTGIHAINTGGYRLVQGTISFTSVTITGVDIDVDFVAGHAADLSLSDQAGTIYFIHVTSTVSGHLTWSGSHTIHDLIMNAVCSSGGFLDGNCTLRSITLRGNGTNPFGVDNC